MGRFPAGQVVFLPFPFSDLSDSKVRPALPIAEVRRGDWIHAKSPATLTPDPRAIPLTQKDFATGGLVRLSFIYPGKLFTANASLF